MQDLLADWEAYFGELGFSQRLAATVLRVCTPKPDIAFWLRLSDEEAAARSSDNLPADFRSAQTGAFAEMADDGSVEPLNAERPWRELSDDIVHQVVGKYYAGYRTVLNALFLKNPGQWR